MNEKRFLIKSCSRIMRKTQAHLDIALKEYGLSSGSYPYLLELSDEEGINLERISRKLNVDKAMSTRTIHRLTEQGFLTKVPDAEDSRACRLYLTEKAKASIPGILEKIQIWIDTITDGLSEEEKDTAVRLLTKIADNTESKGMNQE